MYLPRPKVQLWLITNEPWISKTWSSRDHAPLHLWSCQIHQKRNPCVAGTSAYLGWHVWYFSITKRASLLRKSRYTHHRQDPVFTRLHELTFLFFLVTFQKLYCWHLPRGHRGPWLPGFLRRKRPKFFTYSHSDCKSIGSGFGNMSGYLLNHCTSLIPWARYHFYVNCLEVTKSWIVTNFVERFILLPQKSCISTNLFQDHLLPPARLPQHFIPPW